MAANGHCNGIQDSHSQWKLGLVNEDKKYLTAETFGFKISSSAVSLRKKQVWIIEFGSSDDEAYIKSHLGRYISTDKMGNVYCKSESRNEDDTQFVLEYEPVGGQGRWAFKSKKFNNYLDGKADNMSCSSTTPKWWKPHLATHPQVNMRNVNRKRCLNLRRVGEDGPSAQDQLVCTQVIPWGEDSLITLEFMDGKYAVKTSDDRYLHTSGELVKDICPETLYTLKIRQNTPAPGIALMDSKGKYLTAVGTGQLKSKNQNISKDELFTLLDSQPQVYLVSHKGKKVSIKQGRRQLIIFRISRLISIKIL
jgi:fascin 1/2